MKIYLAGPDVFFPDPKAAFAELIALCEAAGLEGIPPSDGGINAHGNPLTNSSAMAQHIFTANIALIKTCDAVIANLTPFRGIEPDSGTVFEAGFAYALGLPVVGYTDATATAESRIMDTHGYTRKNGIAFDNVTGNMIEEFGLKQNLMLSCSMSIVDTAEQAIAEISAILAPRLQRRPGIRSIQ